MRLCTICIPCTGCPGLPKTARFLAEPPTNRLQISEARRLVPSRTIGLADAENTGQPRRKILTASPRIRKAVLFPTNSNPRTTRLTADLSIRKECGDSCPYQEIRVERVELCGRRGRVQWHVRTPRFPAPLPSWLPSKLGPLCTLRTSHSVISFFCCSACTKVVACDCELATDSFGSGSPEFGLIGALPCAL